MDYNDILESGDFADFTFVDPEKNKLKAHRVILLTNAYFHNYFKSVVGGDDEKSSIGVSSVKVITPILRHIYTRGVSDKMIDEIGKFSAGESMDFYSYVSMWMVSDTLPENMLFLSIMSKIDTIINDDPLCIPTILRIAENILSPDSFGDICLKIVSITGAQTDIPIEIIENKILPKLPIKDSILLLKEYNKPELLGAVFNQSFKDNIDEIAKEEINMLLYGFTYEDGTPVIPHKVLNKIRKFPQMFRETYLPGFMLNMSTKYTTLVVENLVHPCIITKYQNIGSVIAVMTDDGSSLLIQMKNNIKLSRGDNIFKLSEKSPHSVLTIEDITTLSEIPVEKTIKNYVYVVKTQPNPFEKMNSVIKITENWQYITS